MADAKRKSRSSPAVTKQDKDLENKCKEAQEVLAGSESSRTLANYKVGVIARDVKTNKKYGDGTLEKFGKKIGIDHKTLYRFIDVVGVWPEPKVFEELAAKPNKKGRPLTWSHFLALADVPDPKARNAFMQQALEKCLSVRALKKAINPASAKTATKPSKRSKVDATPAAALGHLAQLVEDATKEARQMGVGFPAALAASQATWSSEERENLRKTAEEMLKMTAEVFGLAQGIAQVLKTSDTEPVSDQPPAYKGEIGLIELDDEDDDSDERDSVDAEDVDDADDDGAPMAAS